MTHLSPVELIDHVEGAPDRSRAAHVEACARCREAADALRATLSLATAERRDVPEPSPLFWDHLSARIQEQIAADPAGVASTMSHPWVRLLAPLSAFAVVIAVITMTDSRTHDSRPAPPQAEAAPAIADVERPLDPSIDASTSEVWEVLTAAAADIEWDAAHEATMGVGPGAIDQAVTQLSAAELNELGRLLRNELKGSSD